MFACSLASSTVTTTFHGHHFHSAPVHIPTKQLSTKCGTVYEYTYTHAEYIFASIATLMHHT